MKLYDAPGVDRPLLLDEDYAAELGYSEHVPDDQPSSRASKQAWVDYAISKGADADAVSVLSKSDLIEQYGG
jgi:hypothetical protein